MVAYLYRGETNRFFPCCSVSYPEGLPILEVALPSRYSSRRLAGTAQKLYRRGLRRALSHDPELILPPLAPISPLPLCRAKGAELVLSLVEGTPVRKRRLALRGEAAGPEAWRLAERLCPQVGGLLLDFDRGEEALSRHLRERYGAAPLHLGQGDAPQAAIELAPRPFSAERTLRLWGQPELQGLSLLPERPLPSGFPALPFLELLWETGRVDTDRIRVERAEEWP